MFDPMELLAAIVKESTRVVGEMRKTKDVEQRKALCDMLESLTRSAGVYFDFIARTMPSDMDDDDDLDDMLLGLNDAGDADDDEDEGLF